MRYNMSEIMKAAWKKKKTFGSLYTFSYCLKEAWAKAKEAATIEEYSNLEFENGMTVHYDFMYSHDVYTLNRWTKYGKDRIYVNFENGKNFGYYDLINKKIWFGNYSDNEAHVAFVTKVIEKMNIKPIVKDYKQPEDFDYGAYKMESIVKKMARKAGCPKK